MKQAETFEEVYDLMRVHSCDIEEQKKFFLSEVKRVHELERNRFVRLFVIKRIEKIFEEERKTMNKRSESDQNLIGAYLTISEQNFKNAVKELMK